jgi:hypothetical protein
MVDALTFVYHVMVLRLFKRCLPAPRPETSLAAKTAGVTELVRMEYSRTLWKN